MKISGSFVINDDLKLAAQFGLGVHLGQSDGEITDAKSQLPEGVIIGRTCLNSLELAQKQLPMAQLMLPLVRFMQLPLNRKLAM